MGERFRPTLLRDETASEDEFESKGHQRTADALADTISDLAEFGGGAIGIEGKWGSGKSTVVGLAETTLAERRTDGNGCDFRFFTFDLWTHQSDDFRRSLLEELLNFIENDPVLKKHKDFANEKRDLIRDRIRITTNRTVNRFSLTGLVVLALAPLIPLIYAWFGPSAIDRNADTLPALWAGLNNFQQFSLLLVGSVILIAALSLMTRKDNSITDAASKMLQIFKRESEERTEKQHIREEDPTTVEFHSTFGGILSEIQSPKVRIVFVLDNVDRLPSDLIPTTWASVRSLFSKAKKAAVSSEPIVVVPYDRQHILQVFKQDRDEASTAYIREDLFRKTFSQVLRVAPPISVDWKKYFDKRVSEAFGTHIEPSDTFKLKKLLDLDLQIKQTHPTPRQINTYINDVGILRSQWGDAVPFPALALFVLHRQDFEGNIAHLKSGPLEQRFLDIADLEDWRRDFVSLVFNVESERAYQVLLGPDIEEMLTNPAPKNLGELTQMDGFADVLTDVCHDKAEEWLKGPPRTLSAVMENLAAIKLEPEPHRLTWGAFADRLEALSAPDLGQYENCKGIFQVVGEVPSEKVYGVANTLRSWITTGISNEGVDDRFARGGDWIQWQADIVSRLRKREIGAKVDLFVSETLIPQGGTLTLGVALAARKYGIDFLKLKRQTSKEELKSAADELISDDVHSFVELTDIIAQLFDNKERLSFLDQIAAKLKTASVDAADRTNLLMSFARLYPSFKGGEPARTKLKELMNSGGLVWHAWKASSEKDTESVVAAKWLIASFQKGIAIPAAPGSVQEFGDTNPAYTWYKDSYANADIEDEIAHMATLVARQGNLNAWFWFAVEEGDGGNYYGRVVQQLVKEHDIHILDAKIVVQNFDRIKAMTGDAFPTLIDKMRDLDTDYSNLFAGDDTHTIPTSFLEFVGTEPAGSRLLEIVESVDQHLRSLDKDAWLKALNEGNQDLRLLLDRVGQSKLKLNGNPFREALIEHIGSVISGQTQRIPTPFKSRWSEIGNALAPSAQKSIGNSVLALLANAVPQGSGATLFIELYEPLASQMLFDKEPDASVGLLTALHDSKSATVREWIRQHGTKLKRAFKEASKDARHLLQEALDELATRGSDDLKDWAIELEELVGSEEQQDTEKA